MLLTFYFVAYTKSRVKTESNSNINICCKSICHRISVNAHENDNGSWEELLKCIHEKSSNCNEYHKVKMSYIVHDLFTIMYKSSIFWYESLWYGQSSHIVSKY